MDIILLIFISIVCFCGTVLYFKNYFEERSQRKKVDAVLGERNFIEDLDAVDVEFQPEEENQNTAVFLKIPIELHNKEKKDVKKAKKCEECQNKAESMGVDIKVACPELDCDENEDETNYTIKKTFDYIRPSDIKGFLPIQDGLNIAFYDGQVIHYAISEKKFLEKFSQFVEII